LAAFDYREKNTQKTLLVIAVQWFICQELKGSLKGTFTHLH